jgi:hypothetical protein
MSHAENLILLANVSVLDFSQPSAAREAFLYEVAQSDDRRTAQPHTKHSAAAGSSEGFASSIENLG